MTQFAISIDQTAVLNNKTTTIKCQGRCHVDIMVLSLHLNLSNEAFPITASID